MKKVYDPNSAATFGTLGVHQGGLGARNPVKGAENIGLVTWPLDKDPYGIVLSDSTNRLRKESLPPELRDPDIPSLDGAFEIPSGGTVDFTIMNYDAFMPYLILAEKGTVNRAIDVVRYTAHPGTSGEGSITVNGKVFKIQIRPPVPVTPTISSPAKMTQLDSTTVSLASSVFMVPNNTDSHHSTSWEIAKDAAFEDVVLQLKKVTSYLTEWVAYGLSEYTKHFVRVKYHGVLGGESDWSTPIEFTTGANLRLDEWGSFHPNNLSVGDGFGSAAALSPDGAFALIGACYANTSESNTGTVYFYRRTGMTWVQVSQFSPTDVLGDAYFGWSISLNDSATVAAIGAPGDASYGTNAGAVYIFDRVDTEWVQRQKIVPSDLKAGDLFGSAVGLSGDGKALLIGLPSRDSVVKNAGAVYAYLLGNNTYIYQQLLTLPSAVENDYLGYAIALNNDATLALVGAPGRGKEIVKSGVVSVFTRDSGNWTLQQLFAPTGVMTGAFVGGSLSLSADGQTLAVGAPGVSGGSFKPGVFIFNRSGQNWLQNRKLTPLETAAQGYGKSVTLASNGLIALIGAPDDDSTFINGGNVYFYM